MIEVKADALDGACDGMNGSGDAAFDAAFAGAEMGDALTALTSEVAGL